MTIDKAIEILNASLKTTVPHFDLDERDAITLGIEALKARKRDRELAYVDLDDLLPGEDPPQPKTIPIETLVKIRESPLGKEPGS